MSWKRGLLFLAFDLALALTELDEVCELVTDARYAYGKTGKYVYIFFNRFLVSSDVAMNSLSYNIIPRTYSCILQVYVFDNKTIDEFESSVGWYLTL